MTGEALRDRAPGSSAFLARITAREGAFKKGGDRGGDGASPKTDRLQTKRGDEAVPAPFSNAPAFLKYRTELGCVRRTSRSTSTVRRRRNDANTMAHAEPLWLVLHFRM